MSLLDAYPVTGEIEGHVGPPHGATIEQAFWAFHLHNPHVYVRLVDLTWELVKAGNTKIGIGMLFEVLRWQHALETGGDDFKLNNNYRSYYARLIMIKHPALKGIFETRRLHAHSSRFEE